MPATMTLVWFTLTVNVLDSFLRVFQTHLKILSTKCRMLSKKGAENPQQYISVSKHTYTNQIVLFAMNRSQLMCKDITVFPGNLEMGSVAMF